ncbi:hypothetical protein [Streptococcus ovis]|uniref:hypothetical protein n=1 Tax=Streptococcus ovis TaxID=82806 RepID=UPI00036A88DE|nr:hypothetical protein [Streptococcus ovis]
MKTLGKALANKIAAVIVVVLIVVGIGVWGKSQLFGGTTSAEYQFVIKRFPKKSQLVVADADVATKANKEFNSDMTKDWPEWADFIADLIVSRKVEVTMPVKTEFKLELEDLGKEDISIKNNVLTFNKPLLVYVDSQKVGESKVKKSSSGILDKGVDLVTGSQKAMEFLEEKSQDAIHATSNEVMNDKERQKKVAKFSEVALENLLNLNSEQELDVQISVDDLEFKNIDPKK